MAATVVWCNKCKTAIWAYDHMRDGQDVRGLMNMMRMPCPKCGAIANFDGWSGSDETIGKIIEDGQYEHSPDIRIYDKWSVLKYIFALNVRDGEWAISPDCTWFKRPDDEMESDEFLVDLTQDIAYLVKERYRNNMNLKLLRETQGNEQ